MTEPVATIKAEADRTVDDVLHIIAEIRKSGATTLRDIADALGARGVPSPRGGRWHAMSLIQAALGQSSSSVSISYFIELDI